MKYFFKALLACITMLFLITTSYADDYKFNPTDPSHSLYIPAGNGPFPAILLLHASTGVIPAAHDWAAILKNNGYIVYLIDSFKPRGWKDRESIGWEKATAAQLADIKPAFDYLNQLPLVDKNRIGILGFSMGGFDVLRTMESNPKSNDDFHKLPFRVAASFYGVCHRLDSNIRVNGPTMIFIGSDDDRATTKDCENLIKLSSNTNKNVFIQIYQDALHGFDNFEFPPSKEVIDERGEHYHIGYNAKAREQAIADLIKYFNQYLK